MAGKTVTLEQPIKWHRGNITEIRLREPKYRDFMSVGLPLTMVNVPGGGSFEQENITALGEWIERLCDCEPTALELLSLTDTLALRGAVRDFFIELVARAASRSSTGSAEDLSSSSTPVSRPSTI